MRSGQCSCPRAHDDSSSSAGGTTLINAITAEQHRQTRQQSTQCNDGLTQSVANRQSDATSIEHPRRKQRMCMRSKAWLAASVSLRLARLPPLQAGCGACGCARPSRACFGHKTVKADHIATLCRTLAAQVRRGLAQRSTSARDSTCGHFKQSDRTHKNIQIKLFVVPYRQRKHTRRGTVGCLSFGPIVSLQFSCCDLSVREKDWRSRARGALSTACSPRQSEAAGVTRARQARPLSTCTTH